ncbi:MAG: fructose-bisphosphatase class II family protein [Actinomycetota bacterium]|nr:fructose-bisphosphatase class II family protein [Actinomycetota bacterium]
MGVAEDSAGASEQVAPEMTGGLEPLALAAVRQAAIVAYGWAGRGDGKGADGAATEAMRAVLGHVPGCGTVVIGEGEKDNAPMLFNGERVGTDTTPCFDIAVDPVEGTDLCADKLPGALTTIAMAGEGKLWSPGPGLYMDKLVVGAGVHDAIDLRDEPEEIVERVAAALGKPLAEVTVLILDKKRHVELVERVRSTGASVRLPSAGDVAGALLAAMPDTGVDLLMGVGGTPEGVMAAAAVKELGGAMQTRLAPQSESESEALAAAGYSTDEILELEDLVNGPAIFAATAITGGTLGLHAPRRLNGWIHTHSLLVRPGLFRRIVESTPDTSQTEENT